MDKDEKMSKDKIIAWAIELIKDVQESSPFYKEIATQFPEAHKTPLSEHMVAKILKWLCDKHKLPQLRLMYQEMPNLDGLYLTGMDTIIFDVGKFVTLLTVLEEFGHHLLYHNFDEGGHDKHHKDIINCFLEEIANNPDLWLADMQ